MTQDKDFEQVIRHRMEKTGASYSAARQQLEVERSPERSLAGSLLG